MFQTSDFARIALIIFVARALATKQDYIKEFKGAFLPIIAPIILICGLIAPSNLSTAVLLFVTCFIMMFVGRISMKYVFLLLLMGIGVFALLFFVGQYFPDHFRVSSSAI